jgi:putative ABC transport system permease protein
METVAQDVRYAWRTLRRSPGFAAAALATLALGIGATTAVFSVVYGVLLRPLPYPEPDRIVRLSEEHQGALSPLPAPMLSNLTYHAWDSTARTIEQLAAYRIAQYTVSVAGGYAQLDGAAVTPSLLPLLGATPALGRFFEANEGAEGNDSLLVLSDRAWRERFNADPAIAGRGLVVDGKPATIIGVARPGFFFPTPDTLVWTPRQVQRPSEDAAPGRRGTVSVVFALARLKPGITPAQAEAEGTAAARGTVRPMAANLLFGVGGPPVARVQRLADQMTARVRPALLLLAAAVACLLLMACANVANLFLSRGVARQRELAVRAAIGASRTRLARQLLTESLVLSLAGGAIGLVVAAGLVRAAPLVASREFPRLDAVHIDGRTILCALAVTLMAAVLSGLAPALRSVQAALAESIHGGDVRTTGAASADPRANNLRRTLLAFEAAFAVLLLVGAMLLVRSFVRLTSVDAGYTAAKVLTTQIYVPQYEATDLSSAGERQKAARMRQLVDNLLLRLRAVPAVAAAGAGNMLPLDGSMMIAGFPAPWTAPGGAPAIARALQYNVTPGYAQALGLRLRAGRLFDEADIGAGVTPWIVNEEFARQYLPPSPVGYRFEQKTGGGSRQVEIIGVIANVLKNGNDTKPQAEYYLLPSDDARFRGRFEVAVRTAGDASSLAPALRSFVRELEPAAAVETRTLSDRVSDSVAQPRFAATVLGGFASLALLLASVGLYGVLAYGVSQRRRELGVRAALGASRRTLIALVVRDGLATCVVGLAVGIAAAAMLTRFMAGVLFGVTPLDPIAFVGAPILLFTVALAASVIPGRKAASIDPAEALRCE